MCMYVARERGRRASGHGSADERSNNTSRKEYKQRGNNARANAREGRRKSPAIFLPQQSWTAISLEFHRSNAKKTDDSVKTNAGVDTIFGSESDLLKESFFGRE